MILSECYVTIKTLKSHPEGLSLEELAEKIREYHPGESATMWLTLSQNSHLKQLLDNQLTCVKQVDGRYYFDENSKNYYYNEMVDKDIRQIFEKEKIKNAGEK